MPQHTSGFTGLALVKAQTDTLGFRHLHYQQMYRGIPLWQSDTTIHINAEGNVYRVDGDVIDIPEDTRTEPELTAADAAQTATTALPGNLGWQRQHEALMLVVTEDAARLAWHLTLTHATQRKFVLVDSISGEVIKVLEGRWQ